MYKYGIKSEDAPIDLNDVRLACRQFGMLYFYFCKCLRDALGEEKALALVQQTIFEFGLDRTDAARKRAADQGLETTLENFPKVNDLAFAGWIHWKPEMGGYHCPYGELWLEYFPANPWFKRFASLFCDVIDTTNIENFSRTLSHKITKNILWGDATCEREYFESDAVKKGIFTYGKREN